MKFIFFLLILLLLILFIKNKRESFSNKIIIGSVTTSEFDFGLLKQGEFLIEKEIKPVIIDYTYGEEGKGEQGKVRTYGFEVEKIEEILPEAVKTIGEEKVVRYENIVPLLFEICKENRKKLDKIILDFEKLRKEFVDLQK
tara:strand:+ start:58 stop:480 length:423 start_codon:yes stop_codon:yes gene_type:complete